MTRPTARSTSTGSRGTSRAHGEPCWQTSSTCCPSWARADCTRPTRRVRWFGRGLAAGPTLTCSRCVARTLPLPAPSARRLCARPVPDRRTGSVLKVGNLANATEDRSHFSAWSIISSPLILSFNLTDPARCGTSQHGLYSNKMAMITSDCGATRSPSIKWP